ncbi:hypothetical protein R3P38DRAFT_2532783 [Favolaschia claudopus]|uniref:No apical meristem-associated C-terminal domain-containing protein n=1 Tax=Favolaschia claudopus TaxID=2862362 RepID=A0AAW0B9A3_9AGAR
MARAKKSEPTAPDPPPARTSNRTKNKPAADDDDVVEVVAKSSRSNGTQVNWMKSPHWTHSMATYLTENPDFRRKLFSDSTAAAKKEGRQKKVAKDGKPVQCGTLAKHIFEKDPKEAEGYARNPSKYAGAYQGHLATLGATGAGLSPSEVEPDTKIASLVALIRAQWPWWDDFHSFWRELPRYNPVGVQSSEPGTDHAGAAVHLFGSTGEGSEAVDEGEEVDNEEDEDTGDEMEKKAVYEPFDIDDDEEEDEAPSSPIQIPSSASPSPPPKKSAARKGAKGSAKSGRDLGLAKAAAAKAQASTSAAKKKPQNAIDRLNDIREGETLRLAEKRKLQHTEEMERIGIKRMKLKLKLMQAENKRLRLNRRLSPSPRLRTRVLNITGSSSPSKSRHLSASPRRRFLGSPSPSKLSRHPAGSSSTVTDSLPTTFTSYEFPVIDAAAAVEDSFQFASMPMDFASMDFSAFASTPSTDWYLPPVQ